MAVKSAARVMDVLDILQVHPQGLSLQELSDRLNIPKSSMHELLSTMLERKYLIQSEMKRYTLGFKVIELGLASLDSVNVYQIAKQHMAILVAKIEETVFLAVPSDDEIVYVNKLDCSRSIRTNTILGCRKPMHCTALGKSLLAYSPMSEVERVVHKKGLLAHTTRTITDYNTLILELQKVRQNGIAYDNQEIEEGLSCIAAPIFDYGGRVIAAISVAGPTERIEQRKEEISSLMRDHAEQISAEMGFSTGRNIPLL
ncbi:MAG: IclR family transcriptional regulator [Desulfitobacteriaceae bacterium]